MIVDTSALVAIVLREPEADHFIAALGKASAPRMSTASFFETTIVIDSRRDPISSDALDQLFQDANIVFVPVDERQMWIARRAYRDFGKGSGHPARLNSAIALPTPLPRPWASLCSTRARTSATPT